MADLGDDRRYLLDETETITEKELSPEEQHVERRTEALTTDESCQGPMGVALRDALASITASAFAAGKEDESTETYSLFTPEQQDRIVQAFGSAMATTALGTEPSILQTVATAPRTPPEAKLTGRLEYSNRYGDKWRIVVEDATIVPHQDQQGKTMVAGSSTTTTAEAEAASTLTIPRLEMLAFNDGD